MDLKHQTINTHLSNLSSHSHTTRLAALRHLRLLSNQDPAARPIISAAGAIPHLLDALFSSSHSIQDNAAATLLNISISDRLPLLSTHHLLDAIAHLLSRHATSSSPNAVQSAAATLHCLLSFVPEFRPTVGARRDILHSLIGIIESSDSPRRSVKDALKASFGIALHGPNRAIMVQLGAGSALFHLVTKERIKKIGIMEDATAVIAQIAGCEESEEAFREVSGIPLLSSLLESEGSSLRTKENAVSGLLNLVRCSGDETVTEVREKTVSVEALDGIVYVQEHGSAKGKSKAVALLKLVFDGGSSCNKNCGDLYPVEPDS
ncbi:protein spotted leaf 11-like [Arachis stenosperma]|uniref:protein spotted leaf 11-like n=1 Tax=Arachis stenosperma TaxID=217475 RepID=UPI0025AC7713|nr:protein spotted leaf 11-like [Arachis stenosperma]